MKLAFFDLLEHEKQLVENYKTEHPEVQLDTFNCSLTTDNLDMVNGYDAVTLVSYSKVNRDVLRGLKDRGINYISTRTIGFDHIDIASANEFAMHVYNAYYQPNNVADFTVMLMLMMLRKAKISVCRALVNDFSLDGMQGREMRSMTIGVVGTGKIGAQVIRNLSGFGCKILAYDPYKNESIKNLCEYVSMEEIYDKCDIISLHVPLTDENYHLINRESISKMKDGVIIINTARGQLIDTESLIEGLEQEKIAGAAIDAIEQEDGIMHIHVGTKILDDSKRNLLYLKQFPNVIYTQHYGFYTVEASESMTNCGITSLVDGINGKKLVNEVTKH